MIGRSDSAGPQGSGLNRDVSFTLNTSDRHAVLCMADDNAKAAIDEDLCGTLKVGGRTDHIRRRQTMTSYAIRMRSGKPGGQGSAGTERGERYVGTSNDQTIICMTDTQPNSMVDGETCGTLSCHSRKDPPVVAYAIDRATTPKLMEGSVVRRLTPRECERLQGMPDDWTRIPYRGKPADDCPDGPRYKAIGNSMAVPVMRWIGERIEMVDKLEGINK